MGSVLPRAAGLTLLVALASPWALAAQSGPELGPVVRPGQNSSTVGSASAAAAALTPATSSIFGALEPRRDEGLLGAPGSAGVPSGTSSALVPAAASALVPGVGQYLLGQRRSWAYLALEAVGWVAWADRRSAGAGFRDRYRDFAWDQARLHTGPRVDGSFAYYETLTKWERSGAFDVDPMTSGLQPESDVATFNGAIWARALGLFAPGGASTPPSDPGYQRALDYYREQAYGPDFLWDWNGAAAARAEFGGLIRSSDTRFRQATNVLGVLIAHHAISAVDAFLSARGAGLPGEAALRPAPGPHGARWIATLNVTVPW